MLVRKFDTFSNDKTVLWEGINAEAALQSRSQSEAVDRMAAVGMGSVVSRRAVKLHRLQWTAEKVRCSFQIIERAHRSLFVLVIRTCTSGTA